MTHVIPKFEGKYQFLSNFFPANTEVYLLGDRMSFKNSEAAFQACKLRALSDNAVDAKSTAIRLATVDAGVSKGIGRKIPIDVAKWDAMKDDCMREVVFSKFLQNPDLCAMLCDTEAAMLVEVNTWGDEYWGRVNGKGYNKLGVILMEVRGFWLYSAKTETIPVPETHIDTMMGW